MKRLIMTLGFAVLAATAAAQATPNYLPANGCSTKAGGNLGCPGQVSTGGIVVPGGTPTTCPNGVGGLVSCGGSGGGSGLLVSSPFFTPSGNGSWTPSVTVTVADLTPGASIYYCISTSTPVCTPTTLYTAPLVLSTVGTDYVNAYATAADMQQSATQLWSGSIFSTVLNAPTFNVGVGAYSTPINVVITSDAAGFPGASTNYTLDGSTPTCSSPVYTAGLVGLPISTTTTIKAVACLPGYTTSSVTSGTFTINSSIPQTATPVASPVPGINYLYPNLITLTDATAGAQIYWQPNFPHYPGISCGGPNATLYTVPFSWTNPYFTVAFIACAAGYSTSNVSGGVYGVTLPPPVFAPASPYANAATTVSITAVSGVTFYYCTTAIGAPACNPLIGTTYSVPITFSSSENIYAIAVADALQSTVALWQGTLVSGGSGTVTDGSGTTTAAQVAESTATTHTIQYVSNFGTANLADWTNASIANGDCPVWNSGTSKWTPGSCGGGGGGMVYPGAGIPNSTGSAWGTSLTKFGAQAGIATSADPGTTANVPMVSDGAHGQQTWTGGALGTAAAQATSAFDASGAAAARAAANTCTAGQYATGTGTSSTPCAQVAYSQVSGTPTALPPNGAASGDLSGSYPSPTVAKINGTAVPVSKAFVGSGSSGQIVDASTTYASASQYGIAKCDGTTTTCSSGVITAIGGSLPSGTYGQMIDYNASNAAQAFTPTAQESPVLPQSAGNIPRFTRSVLSAGQNNLTCLGDSYVVTLGGSTWGICNNVANITGYTIANDYAISGYTACNINQSQVFQSISPTSSANTIYLLDGGINDYNLINPGSGFVAPYDLQSQLVPYSANTQACEEANVAWLGTSLTSLQGTPPSPGGAWAADTRFGAVTGLKTSTSSAAATWNITTTVNGQTIFLFYRVIQANSGNANFSVTVDGSTFLPTVSTDFPAPPLPAVSDASDYVGVRILKDISLAAGSHTILVTTNSALAATDVIGIVGVTMVPPTITTSTPQVWAMGVPYLKNDVNSRISAYYNRVVKKSVFDVTATGGESLSGTDSVSPGVAANFVDVRNCNFGTPSEMADNIHASTPTGWVEDATCFINPMPQTPIADYAPDNSWDNATRFGSVSGTGSCSGFYVPMQLSYTDNEVIVENPVSCSGYANVVYLPPPDYGVYQTLGGKRIKVKNMSGVPFQLLCSTTSAWNVCGGSAVGVVIPSGSVAIIDDATIESGTPGWNLESMEPGSSALHETVQISTSTTLSSTTDYVFVPSGTSGDITLTLPGGGGSSELLSPLFATTITVYNDGTHNVLFSASAGNAGSIVLGPQQSGIFWNIVPGGTSFGYWYGGVLTPTAGGGSGTVNSGTSGQVAYYAASGTAVSGETLVTAAQGGTGANNSSASGVSQWASGTQSVSTALVNGTTATTQSAGANDTKLATDAYVDGHYIANGTSAMGTSAIASGACATTVTTSATGVAATDVIVYTPNVNPQGVTGYAVSASGSLYIWAYPTANDVNFEVCNNTASSITPAALTLNWKVTR